MYRIIIHLFISHGNLVKFRSPIKMSNYVWSYRCWMFYLENKFRAWQCQCKASPTDPQCISPTKYCLTWRNMKHTNVYARARAQTCLCVGFFSLQCVGEENWVDSRTIYIGHKEPPPGTEAFIQQRFPDNRIVSSKVSENTHACTQRSKHTLLRSYWNNLDNGTKRHERKEQVLL